MLIQTFSEKTLYQNAAQALSETLQNALQSLSGDLSFAKLHGLGTPDFPTQNLRLKNLTGSQIHDCSFSDCDFTFAQAHNCSLFDTVIMDSDLSHADFRRFKSEYEIGESLKTVPTKIQQVHFHACTLSNSNFTDALIEDSVFIYGADVNGINFANAKIRRSDFNYLSLKRPNLENSQISDCQFRNVHWIGGAGNTLGCQLQNCSFSFCIFENMDLSEMQFTDTAFYNCQFVDCQSSPETFKQCLYRTSPLPFFPETKGSVPQDNHTKPWLTLNSDTIRT